MAGLKIYIFQAFCIFETIILQTDQDKPCICRQIHDDCYFDYESYDFHQVFDVNLKSNKDHVFVGISTQHLIFQVSFLFCFDEPIDHWLEQLWVKDEHEVSNSCAFGVPEDAQVSVNMILPYFAQR